MDVVGDQDNGRSSPHQATDDVEVLKARLQIKTAGRLIQYQRLGVVD